MICADLLQGIIDTLEDVKEDGIKKVLDPVQTIMKDPELNLSAYVRNDGDVNALAVFSNSLAKENGGNLQSINTALNNLNFEGDYLKVTADLKTTNIRIGSVALKDAVNDVRATIELDDTKNALFVQSETLALEGGNLKNVRDKIVNLNFTGDDLKVRATLHESGGSAGRFALTDTSEGVNLSIDEDVSKNAAYVQSESLAMESGGNLESLVTSLDEIAEGNLEVQVDHQEPTLIAADDDSFANNASPNTQKTFNLIAPNQFKKYTRFVFRNPSAETDLTVKILTDAGIDVGGTTKQLAGSFIVPAKQTITGTEIDGYANDVFSDVFLTGEDATMVVSNNQDVGASGAFSFHYRVFVF